MGPTSHIKQHRLGLAPYRQFSDKAERNAAALRAENARRTAAALAKKLGERE